MQKLHPQKFALWIAISSIIMMFAGLTSAYMVKKNSSNWLQFNLPSIFWISTITIIISSLTMVLSRNAFIQKRIFQYRNFLIITLLLGCIFIILQYLAFQNMEQNHISLVGSLSNPAASFILVIAGLHILHVLGGLIAVGFVIINSLSRTTRNYVSLPIDLISTYWHFIGVLWIYLFIFLYFFH